MLRNITLVCLALVALTWAADIQPTDAITQKMNYQGYLTDPSGNPVTATVSMVFNIYSAASGGTSLWTETHASVSVQNGYYDVQLGSVTAIPLSIFAVSPQRWLQVTVAGVVMSPRIELTASAFAFKASDADKIAGKDTTALDARYVNEGQANSIRSGMIAVPCTLSGNAALDFTLLRVQPSEDAGVVVYRTSTGTTNPAIFGQTTSGSGGGVTGYTYDSSSSGVLGRNLSVGKGPGVYGLNSSGYVLPSRLGAGVEAYSSTGPAFYVANAGQQGLRIRKCSDIGVEVDTTRDFGMYVVTCSLNGVRVQNTWRSGYSGFYSGTSGGDGFRSFSGGGNGLSVSGADANGVYVQSCDSAGLYVSSSGTYGAYASSSNQRGGYFRNQNNSYYALTAMNAAGSGGTYRGLYVQGHGYATGGWQTFLDGEKPGHAVISPNREIVFSGSSSLSDGRSQVVFDAKTAGILDDAAPVRVIVTPTTECNGVFVSEKSTRGFRVKELQSGSSAASFDWMVVAQLKDVEARPNAVMPEADQPPAAPVDREEDRIEVPNR